MLALSLSVDIYLKVQLYLVKLFRAIMMSFLSIIFLFVNEFYVFWSVLSTDFTDCAKYEMPLHRTTIRCFKNLHAGIIFSLFMFFNLCLFILMESQPSISYLHLFFVLVVDLWEETGAPIENPQRTPHKKTAASFPDLRWQWSLLHHHAPTLPSTDRTC